MTVDPTTVSPLALVDFDNLETARFAQSLSSVKWYHFETLAGGLAALHGGYPATSYVGYGGNERILNLSPGALSTRALNADQLSVMLCVSSKSLPVSME